MSATSLFPYGAMIQESDMFNSFIAVLVGGGAGCLLRWWCAMRFNPLFADLPLGTLLVNLVGGFIIGGALAWFARHPQLDPAWKLLITTGLCGGLTTFSTFSAELMGMLQSGKYLWAMTSASLHLFGTLLMTFAGFALVNFLG